MSLNRPTGYLTLPNFIQMEICKKWAQNIPLCQLIMTLNEGQDYIKTGIKLYTLVVSVIKTSLKEIGHWMPQCKPMLKVLVI